MIVLGVGKLKLKELNMEELDLAKDNIKLYFAFLNRYRKIRDYHNDEEYQQEILVAFHRAAKKFDPTNGARFSTYCWVAMKRARGRFFENLLHEKRLMHKKMHSLERYMANRKERKKGFCNDLAIQEPDEGEMVPVVEIYRNYLNKAKPRVKYIFERRAEGESMESIAKVLGCSRQNVHCTIETHSRLMRNYSPD